MIKQKIYNFEKAREKGISFKEFLINFLTDKETDLSNYKPECVTFDMWSILDRVKGTLKKASKIAIVGDYDGDGMTSSAIIYKTLRAIWPDKEYQIILPDRMNDGYGIKNKHVDMAKEEGADLIITVDNGINAVPVLKYANSLGIATILTDHHIPNDDEYKDLDFVLNPHTSKSNLVEKEICGAMVALLFSLNLMKECDYKASDKFVKELKEIASIGTIADSMPIRYENRALLSECMPRFLEGVAINKGLQLLISSLSKFTKLEQDNIAFYLVPCINACGRLDSAYLGFHLLTETNIQVIAKIASKLVSLNERRKLISQDIEAYLNEQIDANSKVQILQVPKNYHNYTDREIGGVVGITASKIVEASHEPSLIFYGNKFSGRSMPDVNLNELLASSKTPTFTFGGHAQACGGGINFDEYGASLKEELSKNVSGFSNNVFYEKYIRVPSDMNPLEILNAFMSIKPCNLVEIPKLMMENVIIKDKTSFYGHAQLKFELGGLQKAIKFYDTLEDVKTGDVVKRIIFKISPAQSKLEDYSIIIESIER